jgi:DNA-binding NarL/FixJ family response regulator
VVDVLPDDQFFEDPNVLGTLATAEYFLDRYAEANDHVERALRIARASGRGQYVPLLYWSSSDPDLAERQAMAAAEAFAVAGAVLEAEKSRVLLGEALAASGRTGSAVEHLSRASALFEECSADGLRAEVDRQLRKLGRRRSAAPGHPHRGLPRASQLRSEVALLVADGKTNPQIAAELFHRGKTVESQVRHAFQELHVASRLELARLVDSSWAHDS